MVRLLLEAWTDAKSEFHPLDASCPMVWHVMDDDGVMEIICEYGTDVSDTEDRSILNYAVENRISFERIKLLVEHGANLCTVENGYGIVSKLISYGYQIQDVEWMLAHGAPVQTSSGKTGSTPHNEPLCSAIENKNLEMLKNNFQLEYHKARSIVGMFRHFFYSIATYMINRNLDFYQNFFRLRLI